MAIYTYRCRECGREEEVVQSISSYCVAPNVPVCPGGDLAEAHIPCRDWHGPMERRLVATMVAFDTAPWAAYQSPIDGQVIDSRAKRNEHMAKHGVVPYDELKPDFERNRKRIAEEARVGLKDDLIVATNRVADGYKPVVETTDKFIPG